MNTKLPFVPLFDTGIFESTDQACIADIVVPLMLVRHVAEGPDAALFPQVVEQLRKDIAQMEQTYPFVTGWAGDKPLGVILYPSLKKAEVKGTTRTRDGETTTTVTLSTNGVHLLHGWLTFALLLLTENPPVPENADVATVLQHLLTMRNNDMVEVFRVTIVDTMGRPCLLQARWYPGSSEVSWEWSSLEGDQPAGGIWFNHEQTEKLAGFFTLLRLACPEWSWQDKGK